jgi:hypothetical protein
MARRAAAVVAAVVAGGAVGVGVAADPSAATRFLAPFASAAYCGSADGLDTWQCAPCRAAAPAPTRVWPVVNATEALAAFVAVLPPANGDDPGSPTPLIVSFRGTDPSRLPDWLADLYFPPIAPYPACPDGCAVHAGFYSAWRTLSPAVADAIAAAGPSRVVHVTGHSLGAALATFAAYEFALAGLPLGDVVTFGGPRTGNAAWAAAWDAVVRRRDAGAVAAAAAAAAAVAVESANTTRAPQARPVHILSSSGRLGPPVEGSRVLMDVASRARSGAPPPPTTTAPAPAAPGAAVRVTHDRDPVPHLPPLRFGFRHPPQ